MFEKVKLKVCGMRDPENIRSIAALQPDYMGFIFYAKSPRYVGQGFVLPEISDEIKRVGVFVNGKNDEMKKAVADHKLNFLQLHGNEPVAQVKSLADDGISVWKAFAVDAAFNFEFIEEYAPYVKGFLFDTKGKHYGGNATTFDWTVLQKYNQRVPFLLSGGLNADNISAARLLTGMNLHGFDVNSGVESAPGVKDLSKLEAVISEMINTIDHK